MNSEEQLSSPLVESSANAGRNIRFMTLGSVFVASQLPEIISKSAELGGLIHRNVLPEPWDLPDHVGNFSEAGMYTAATVSLLSLLMYKRAGDTTLKNINRATVGAFAVSCAIQVLGEKYGSIIGYPNNGDMLDSAYGIVWSAGAAVACNYGYRRAQKADKKYVNFVEARLSEQNQAPRGTVNSNSRTIAKQVSSGQKKNLRKQQSLSRRKNR